MKSLIRNLTRLEFLLFAVLLTAISYFLYKSLGYLKNAPFVDFKCYYYAAKQAVSNLPVYPNEIGYLYPLFFAVLISPLGLFSDVQAQYLWTFFNILVFILSLIIILKTIKLENKTNNKIVYLLALIIAFTFRPVTSDLNHGQVNLVILLLVSMAWYFYKNNKFSLSSLCIAIGAVIKVTPALFLILFIINKKFKAAIAFLVFVILLLFIPSLKYGHESNVNQTKVWFEHVISPYITKVDIPAGFENQSLASVIKRYCSDVNTSYAEPITVGIFNLKDKHIKRVTVFLLGLIMVNTLWILWKLRNNSSSVDFQFSLIILTMLFVSGISWIYHYVLLLIPILVLLRYSFEAKSAFPVITLLLSLLLVSGTTSMFVGLQLSMKFAAYGVIFWAGFVLYVFISLLLWRLIVEIQKHLKIQNSHGGIPCSEEHS